MSYLNILYKKLRLDRKEKKEVIIVLAIIMMTYKVRSTIK